MKTIKRPIRIEGDIAYVPLTKGYEAVIDASDAPLVRDRNWQAMVTKYSDGRVNKVYAASRGGILLHRVIMEAPPDMDVDHRDGDGLHCRRGNMRLATEAQNNQNIGMRRANRSGVKGVYFAKDRGAYRAQISVSGRNRSLGLFKCRTAASLAYMKASRIHHGDFGRTAYGQGQQGTGGTGSLQDSGDGSPIQPA
jgi:hypothetical protein